MTFGSTYTTYSGSHRLGSRHTFALTLDRTCWLRLVHTILVNVRHVKSLPDRKSYVSGYEWLRDLQILEPRPTPSLRSMDI